MTSSWFLIPHYLVFLYVSTNRKKQQKNHSTYNVLGCYKIIIVAVKTLYYIVFQLCVCNLSFQCACTILYIVVICGLSGCNVYISTLCHKRHDFRKNITTCNMCVQLFSTNFSAALIFRKRTYRDIVINVRRSLSEVLIILVRFKCNLNLVDRFSENSQVSNMTKVPVLGTELLHADRSVGY